MAGMIYQNLSKHFLASTSKMYVSFLWFLLSSILVVVVVVVNFINIFIIYIACIVRKLSYIFLFSILPFWFSEFAFFV